MYTEFQTRLRDLLSESPSLNYSGVLATTWEVDSLTSKSLHIYWFVYKFGANLVINFIQYIVCRVWWFSRCLSYDFVSLQWFVYECVNCDMLSVLLFVIDPTKGVIPKRPTLKIRLVLNILVWNVIRPKCPFTIIFSWDLFETNHNSQWNSIKSRN